MSAEWWRQADTAILSSSPRASNKQNSCFHYVHILLHHNWKIIECLTIKTRGIKANISVDRGGGNAMCSSSQFQWVTVLVKSKEQYRLQSIYSVHCQPIWWCWSKQCLDQGRAQRNVRGFIQPLWKVLSKTVLLAFNSSVNKIQYHIFSNVEQKTTTASGLFFFLHHSQDKQILFGQRAADPSFPTWQRHYLSQTMCLFFYKTDTNNSER